MVCVVDSGIGVGGIGIIGVVGGIIGVVDSGIDVGGIGIIGVVGIIIIGVGGIDVIDVCHVLDFMMLEWWVGEMNNKNGGKYFFIL